MSLRISRKATIIVTLGFGLLGPTVWATSVPLSATDISNVVSGLPGGFFKVDGIPGGGSSALDGMHEDQFGSSSASSIAEVAPGKRPQAVVEMDVSAVGRDEPQFASAGASARARVEYFTEVLQTSPFLVYMPPTIPMLIHVRGETSASASGTGLSESTAQVSVSSVPFTSVIAEMAASAGPNNFPPPPPGVPPNFSKTVSVNVPTNTTVRFRTVLDVIAVTSARADALTLTPDGGSASAQALADPLFMFDQDAFNAQAIADGAVPFLLEDFFTIETSLDIIPEPSTIYLGALGAVVLWTRRRRTRLNEPHDRWLDVPRNPRFPHRVRRAAGSVC